MAVVVAMPRPIMIVTMMSAGAVMPVVVAVFLVSRIRSNIIMMIRTAMSVSMVLGCVIALKPIRFTIRPGAAREQKNCYG